jgi:hypothetical protein
VKFASWFVSLVRPCALSARCRPVLRPVAFGVGREQPPTKLVRLLLEQKSDVDVTDKVGETALHLAASNRHEATVQLLLSASNSNFLF